MISMAEMEKLEQGMRRDWEILEKGGQVGPRSIGEVRIIKPRVPKPTFKGDGISLIIIPTGLTYLADLDGFARTFRVEKTTKDGTQIRPVCFKDPMRVTQDGIWIPQDRMSSRGRQPFQAEAQLLDPQMFFSGDPTHRKFLKSLGMK